MAQQVLSLCQWCSSQIGGGGGGGLTPGFEAPKLSEHFWALSNFFIFFFGLTSHGVLFLQYFAIFHNSNSKIFQRILFCLTSHGVVLAFGLGFTYFRLLSVHISFLILVTAFISCYN